MEKEEIEKAINTHDWYQKIPLVYGIDTPGKSDCQKKLELIQLPETLTDKSVLDIGCNEGFFAFEAGRRGAARILAIDKRKESQEKFELTKRILGCTAEFRLMNVYDLEPAVVGQFDVVFFLSVFHHLRYPFLALDKIAAVTKEVAIMEIVEAVPKQPSQQAVFVRRLGTGGQLRMLPTRELLMEILERAGFPRVQILGSHRSNDPSLHRKMYDYSQQRVLLKAYR